MKQQWREGAATSRPRPAAAEAAANGGTFEASFHGWDALKMMAEVAATGAVPPLQEGEVAEPGWEGGGPSGRLGHGTGWPGQQVAAGFGAAGSGLVPPAAAGFGASDGDTTALSALPSATSSVQIPDGYFDSAPFGSTAAGAQALFGMAPGSFYVMLQQQQQQQQYFLQPQHQSQYPQASSHPLLLHPLGGGGYQIADHVQHALQQDQQLNHPQHQQGQQLNHPHLGQDPDGLLQQQAASSALYGAQLHSFALQQLAAQQLFPQAAAQQQQLYAIPVIQLADLPLLAWHNQQQQLQGSFQQLPPTNHQQQIQASAQHPPPSSFHQTSSQHQIQSTNQHPPPSSFQQASNQVQPQQAGSYQSGPEEAPRVVSTTVPVPLNAHRSQPQAYPESGLYGGSTTNGLYAGSIRSGGGLASLLGGLGALPQHPYPQGGHTPLGGNQRPADAQYQLSHAADQHLRLPLAGPPHQLPPAIGPGVAIANVFGQDAVPPLHNSYAASWMARSHTVPSTPGSQGDWAARVSDEGNIYPPGNGRGCVQVQAPTMHRTAMACGVPPPHGGFTAAANDTAPSAAPSGLPPHLAPPRAGIAAPVVLDLRLPRG